MKLEQQLRYNTTTKARILKPATNLHQTMFKIAMHIPAHCVPHCPNNNLNLSLKTEPVTAGAGCDGI